MNTYNIPKDFLDFVDGGGKLPENNNYVIELLVKRLNYEEKEYKNRIYIRDADFYETSEVKGYYVIKYIEIIKEKFKFLVWLTELGCFGSIDNEHDAVFAFECLSWSDIMEDFDSYCNPGYADVGENMEQLEPNIPLHDPNK